MRIPHFRRLLGALATSQLGDWIYNYALLAFVYERTGSSTWVVATMVARLGPLLVLGPVGGLIADRLVRLGPGAEENATGSAAGPHRLLPRR